MRLTVLGRSPARPNPGEACAGYLLDGGGARVLLDIGPGVVAQMLLATSPDTLDAVIVSHMHTDHYLDLVTLRYAYPWLEEAKKRLKVIVPPGSADQLADLARGAGYPDFFARSFDFVEHDGERPFEIGGMRFEPYPMQHFVPTWGFRVHARGTDEDAPRRSPTRPTPRRPMQSGRSSTGPICSCARRRCEPWPRTPDRPSRAGTCCRPRRARSRPAGRSASSC